MRALISLCLVAFIAFWAWFQWDNLVWTFTKPWWPGVLLYVDIVLLLCFIYWLLWWPSNRKEWE